MSVWTKVNNKVLYENVDMEHFNVALSNMNLTLDNSIKEVKNKYGKSKVDAALKYNNVLTAVGIQINSKKGINIVGDTWRSGIVGDNKAEKLINLIAQEYQKVKITKNLEIQGWNINTIKKDDKIVLECTNYN